jgi:hypothetical protein
MISVGVVLPQERIAEILQFLVTRPEGMTIPVKKVGNVVRTHAMRECIRTAILTVKVTEQYIAFATESDRGILHSYMTTGPQSRAGFYAYLVKVDGILNPTDEAEKKKSCGLGPNEGVVSFQRSP